MKLDRVFTLSGLLFFTSLPIAHSQENDFHFEEYRLGVNSAIQDLSQGRIRYDRYGQSLVVDAELQRRSKDEFNVEVVFCGCVLPPRQEFHLGYHGTVLSFLELRFGGDPVRALEKELLAASRGEAAPGQESD